jgi:signal transduction histidine kinase
MNTMDSHVVDDDTACPGRVQFERVIERLNSELRSKADATRHKQEFESSRMTTGGVAHVSGALLNVIDNLLLLVEKQLDPRPQDRHPQARQETQISPSIYCLKAIDSQITAVVEIVDRLVQQVRPLFGSRMLAKVGSIDPQAIIFTDRNLLHQALMNLCINARDTMLSDGVISIDAVTVNPTSVKKSCLAHASHNLPSERYVSIRLSDTGCSIPQNLRERIFSPFVIARNTGKATALCLSTVQMIIKQHGGWIELESGYSVGTSVIVNLPLVDVSPQDPLIESAENTPSLGKADAKLCSNCGCIIPNVNMLDDRVVVGRLAP